MVGRMDVCSLDDGIEYSFWRNYGPQNESILQLMTRSYSGLCDRIYKPPRMDWKEYELESADFAAETFLLRTSGGEQLQCAYFQLEMENTIFKNSEVDSVDSGDGEDSTTSGQRDSEDSLDTALHDTLVLYLHTNCTNLVMAKEILPVCKALNASMLAYDLRGHGKSSGDGLADLDTNILDLERVVDWSRSKATNIILWSRGLSTCIATSFMLRMIQKEKQVNAKLSANSFIRFQNPIRYLVLDSPWGGVEELLKDSIKRVHALEYSGVPKNLFDLVARFFRRSIRNRSKGMDPFTIKPINDVPDIHIPASFLLPTDDDYIPLYHGTDMAAAYGGVVFARIFEGEHFGNRDAEVVKGVVKHIHSHIHIM